MKEQWKRLDSNAKQLVDVEEGKSTPIKIEIPVIPAVSSNERDYCQRLIAILRVCVLLALLFLLILLGINLCVIENNQSASENGKHSAPGYEALTSVAWFHDLKEIGNEEYAGQKSIPEDKIYRSAPEPSPVDASRQQLESGESFAVPDVHVSEDTSITQEALSPPSNPTEFKSTGDEIPSVNHIIVEKDFSNDVSQNLNEMRVRLEHIEHIVEENQKILNEKLVDEKIDEVPSSEFEESRKDSASTNFMNHLLADMIIAAEKELEKSGAEKNQNGEQMIVDVPEPQFVDYVGNTQTTEQPIEGTENFEASLLDLLLSAIVNPSDSDDTDANQQSEIHQTDAEPVDIVSPDDVAAAVGIEERHESLKSEEEGLLDFIASGLLSPFASKNVESDTELEPADPNIISPVESLPNSQENTDKDEDVVLDYFPISLLDSLQVQPISTSQSEDEESPKIENRNQNEDRKVVEKVMTDDNQEAQGSFDELESRDSTNEESMILPHFDRVDFWNKFWEKRHLNRFVKCIAPMVGDNFELFDWYKKTSSRPSYDVEDDKTKAYVAELLYSADLHDFDEVAIIVTNIVSQNPSCTESMDSQETENISSDTAASQIALLLFKKATLNELLRTGDIDEAKATSFLEEYINMIEDIVREESRIKAEYIEHSDTGDEEINNQRSLSSLRNDEATDDMNESQDKVQARYEHVLPQTFPHVPLGSGRIETDQRTSIDEINNSDESSIDGSYWLRVLPKEVVPLRSALLAQELVEDESAKVNEPQEKVTPQHEEVVEDENESTGSESMGNPAGPFGEMRRELQNLLKTFQTQEADDSKYSDGPYPYFDDYYD